MAQLQRYSASLNMRPTSRQSYWCYLSYDRSCIPGKTEKRYLTAGLSSSFRIGEGTLLDVGFRSNNHESGHGLADNMFDITVSHRFANKHIILARGYYRPWQSASGHDEAAISLEYSVPVGLPVAKRQNIGAVRGHIYDEITELPVADAIVWLDGVTAVTDAKGFFVVPSVAKGDYNLRVVRSSIGLDRITTQKMPIPVSVTGGEETLVDIGVTHGASLRGRIMLYRLRSQSTMPSAAEEKDLVEDKGLPNILVELSDGVETRRAFTDIDGRFVFEEMRPGDWTLNITDDNLPEHSRLEKTSYQFRPMPGEQKTALVKVVPVRRRIQILEEGGVLKEEKIGE
jgi:hypothetical protein